MDQLPWYVPTGLVAFFAAIFAIAWQAPSLYFGLTMNCLFMVSSASLTAYAHGLLFGIPPTWLTADHQAVLEYSIAGCLAMTAGIAIAWLRRGRHGAPRLADRRFSLAQVPWINVKFGWFVFLTGIAGMFLEMVLLRVPTLGTAIHSLASFATLGLLVLLAEGLSRRRFGHFLAAGAVYAVPALMYAFASGHTPVKVSLLFPAMCILAGHRRISAKSVAVIVVCGFVFLSMMSGWMKTRMLIRSGQLDSLDFLDQLERFLPAWFVASTDSALDVESANETIRLRIDMTDILAMQVRHQPRTEPFAYGGTVLDAGVALVPRIFWRDKPVIAGGSAFVSRFTGMRRDPNDTTSIGLPYQFELYANGGPICVVVGLFVVGLVCATMERGLFVPTASLGSLLARASITMTLCDGGQRTDVVLPWLIAGGVTFFALGKFVDLAAPQLAGELLGRQDATPRHALAGIA